MVGESCDQRVVRVPYLCSGDRVCSQELRVGCTVVECSHRGRTGRICNVDYLDTVVGLTCNQRVVQVPPLDGGNRVAPCKIRVACAICYGGHGHRAGRICDVDYLDAIVVDSADQRVARVPYLDGGKTAWSIHYCKRPASCVPAAVLYRERLEVHGSSEVDPHVDDLAWMVRSIGGDRGYIGDVWDWHTPDGNSHRVMNVGCSVGDVQGEGDDSIRI